MIKRRTIQLPLPPEIQRTGGLDWIGLGYSIRIFSDEFSAQVVGVAPESAYLTDFCALGMESFEDVVGGM